MSATALYAAAKSTVADADEQELTRSCFAVCTSCGRGDDVDSESVRAGPTEVVVEHVCERCDEAGHTVKSGRAPDKTFKTGGTVRTVDLTNHEEYRGTF